MVAVVLKYEVVDIASDSEFGLKDHISETRDIAPNASRLRIGKYRSMATAPTI